MTYCREHKCDDKYCSHSDGKPEPKADPLHIEQEPPGTWCAYFDPEGLIGRGKYGADAVRDLLDQTDEAMHKALRERNETRKRLSEALPAEAEYEVILVNDDGAEEWAAGAVGPRDQALAEARNYAMQYAKDGPVRIVEVTRRTVETLSSLPTTER